MHKWTWQRSKRYPKATVVGIYMGDECVFAADETLAQFIVDACNEKEARDEALKPGEALQLAPDEDWCADCQGIVRRGHKHPVAPQWESGPPPR